jgi:nucleoid-associated protein YejK
VSLKTELKREAIKLGIDVASDGFRSWMDRFARKRPRGLVSRFRSFFGIERQEDSDARHREMLQAVQDYINERDRRDNWR